MSPEMLSALALFALVSSITPGPNNLMLMASGANFGFRRTLPHMMGVGLGFMLMLFLVGVGLIGLFDAVPASYTAMKVASVLYMSFLAWKIATAAAPQNGTASGKPFSFLQAAAFQWVNPKAWTMALSAVTLYAPDRSYLAIAIVTLVFGAINLPSISLWTILGLRLQVLLTSRARLRLFNGVMAALLLGSLIQVLWS
jgi:threonine/homoserine/homoserine lactone efflux protein